MQQFQNLEEIAKKIYFKTRTARSKQNLKFRNKEKTWYIPDTLDRHSVKMCYAMSTNFKNVKMDVIKAIKCNIFPYIQKDRMHRFWPFKGTIWQPCLRRYSSDLIAEKDKWVNKNNFRLSTLYKKVYPNKLMIFFYISGKKL